MTVTEYNNCVELFADRVFRFIIKNVKQESDAQDIVQNAFEILWRNHKTIEFSKARSYLFSVSYNNMIDQFRKMKRIHHTDEVPDQAVLSQSQQQSDLKDILNKGLEMLNEVQRSVLLLRDYEGYSYKEIAELTKLNEAQVKVYIFRGRKKLQQYLVSVDCII